MQDRLDTYHERFLDENMVFNKEIRPNAQRLITFLNKTKCLSRKPTLSKTELSPTRTHKGQKRKASKCETNSTNPTKQTKLTHFLAN